MKDYLLLTEDEKIAAILAAGGKIVNVPMVEVTQMTLGRDNQLESFGIRLVSIDEAYEMLKSKNK